VLVGVGPESTQADREDALCRLEDLTAAIGVRAGPLLGPKVRAATERGTIEALVAALVAAGPAEPATNPRLWGRLTGAEEPEPIAGPRAKLLEEVLGEPLREILWKRSLLGATVAHAAIGAMQLEEKVNRSARTEPPITS
jgi:hypothetical protein